MSEFEVLFNYRQAIAQADKLDQAAKKLENLSTSKLETTLGTLKNAWQSDNSSQYYQKVASVQNEIKGTAANIRKIAGAIRTTAEAVKEAELAALEIARSRTYG